MASFFDTLFGGEGQATTTPPPTRPSEPSAPRARKQRVEEEENEEEQLSESFRRRLDLGTDDLDAKRRELRRVQIELANAKPGSAEAKRATERYYTLSQEIRAASSTGGERRGTTPAAPAKTTADIARARLVGDIRARVAALEKAQGVNYAIPDPRSASLADLREALAFFDRELAKSVKSEPSLYDDLAKDLRAKIAVEERTLAKWPFIPSSYKNAMLATNPGPSADVVEQEEYLNALREANAQAQGEAINKLADAEAAARARKREQRIQEQQDAKDALDDDAEKRQKERRDATERRVGRLQDEDRADDAASVALSELSSEQSDDEAVEGAKDDEDESAAGDLDEIDAGVYIDSHIPGAARFVSMFDDNKLLTFEELLAVTIPGGGAPFIVWEKSIDIGGTTYNNVLRVQANIGAIHLLFIAFVQPLLEAWDTEDSAELGRTAASLHARYWTDTVVPLMTQVALQLRVLVENDFAAEEIVDENGGKYAINQQLRDAAVEFKQLLKFVVLKGLTGSETGEIDDETGKPAGVVGSLQEVHKARPSAFDRYQVYRADLTIKATNTEVANTNNQLLRNDKVLRATVPGSVTRLRPRPSKAEVKLGERPLFLSWEENGLISTPLLKILFTRTFEPKELGEYNQNGASLFSVEEAKENEWPGTGEVEFERLIADKRVPKRPKPSAGLSFQQASQQSYESFVSRTLALPVFDALYLDNLFEFEDVDVVQWSLQSVGDGLAKGIYERMPVLPAFFTPNGQVVAVTKNYATRDGEAVDRDVVQIKPLIEGKGLEKAEITTASFVDIWTLTRQPKNNRAPAEARQIKALILPVVLQQIANIDEIFRNAGKANIEERFEMLHRVVAAALFTPIRISDDPDDNNASLFQRFGWRPRYFDPDGEVRFFLSNAKPTTTTAAAAAASTKVSKTDAHSAAARAALSKGKPSTDTVQSQAIDFPGRFVPRVARKIMSKAIENEKERAREILTWKRWLTKAHLGGALAHELDNPNEKERTVLVFTDNALKKFQRSTSWKNATRGQSKEQQEKTLYQVFLYHILSGEHDFKDLRGDDAAADIPTELVIRGDDVVHMKIRVSKRYDTVKGGTFTANEDADVVTKVSVSGARYAKNGIYYIVDEVIDPAAAIREEVTEEQFEAAPSGIANIPPPLASVFGDEEEEVEFEESDAKAGDQQQKKSATKMNADLSESELRTALRLKREVNEDRFSFVSTREALERLDKEGRLGNLTPGQAERLLQRLDVQTRRNTDTSKSNARSTKSKADAKKYVPAALSEAKLDKTLEASYAKASSAVSSELKKARADAAVQNEKDSAEWMAYLKRTGTLSKVDAAIEKNIPVHIFVPTPTALAEAGIDLKTASAELGEGHVGFGKWSSRDGTKDVSAPMTAQVLHELSQRDGSTPVTTLHKDKVIYHMSAAKHGKNSVPGNASNQLFLGDVQFREPQPTYKHSAAPAKADSVQIHFINRVLHHTGGGADAVAVQSKAAPVKNTPAPASAAPTASVADAWRQANEEAAKKLASAKTANNYEQHVLELDQKLNQLGSADAVTRVLKVPDIERHFKALRSAVARNTYVDSGRKADAHTAINKLRARFPAE